MIIFKLDNDYLPSTSVKEFKTAIWTERYDIAGDFKIVAEDDISLLTLLPKGTLISHTDTLEVMQVETHNVVRNEEKKLLVTVSGRSVETFSENRPTEGSDLSLETEGVANTEVLLATPSCHAAAHILKYKLEPGTASTDDEIPNLLVVESVTTHDAAMDHPVKRGSVYSQLLEFLKMSKTGVKSVRPNGVQTTLNLVVHDGVDRTTSVIFYAQYEDLRDAEYLTSIKNYKNYARVAGKVATRLHRHRDLGSDLTGWDRRILYVDANDLEDEFTSPTTTDAMAGKGQAALDENRALSLISATISETARPKFKRDYEVGDIVTVYGEFSESQAMRVTEHILTVDETGVKGYPALTAI